MGNRTDFIRRRKVVVLQALIIVWVLLFNLQGAYGIRWFKMVAYTDNPGGGDIAIDSSDNIGIGVTGTISNTAGYVYLVGNTWQVADYQGSDASGGVSLAFSQEGIPYLVYTDMYGGPIIIAHPENGVWEEETVDPHYSGNISFNSLAFDNEDHPHVVYYGTDGFSYDAADPVYVKHAYYDGTTWHVEKITQASGSSLPSIAIGTDDTIHVAWIYDAGVEYDVSLWYAKSTVGSGSWTVETTPVDYSVTGPPGPSIFVGYGGVIALDSHNNPYICYTKHSAYEALFVASKTGGGSWNVEQVVGDLQNGPLSVGEECQLALDSRDNLHILYTLENDDVKYAVKVGSSWIHSFVGKKGYWSGISMVLDSRDQPHLAYQDDRYLMIYATILPPYPLPISYNLNQTNFTGGADYDDNHLELVFFCPLGLNVPVDLYISLTQPSTQGGTVTYYFEKVTRKVVLSNGIYFNRANPVTNQAPYFTGEVMPDEVNLYGPSSSSPLFNDGWVIPAPALCDDLPDGDYVFTIQAFDPQSGELLATGKATVTLARGCP